MIREEFIGDVVRHTKSGVAHCQGHPQMGKVDYGPHNCKESIEAGDGVITSVSSPKRSFHVYPFVRKNVKDRRRD